MIITAILQVRNEESSGHLERFLKWNRSVFDNLIAYDDCSTDRSVAMLRTSGAFVVEGELHSFYSELHVKRALLSEARLQFPSTDWFLWLDADELLLASRDEIEIILLESEKSGTDGIRLPLVNLWRNELQFRVDSGFNDLKNVRFWKNSNQLGFNAKPGLHHSMHPDGMRRIAQIEHLRVLHFGFSSELLILSKFYTYREAGQRGRNLWRLVDESALEVQDIEFYSTQLGERFKDWFDSQNFIKGVLGSEILLEKCRLPGVGMKTSQRPTVTLISLIYAGVDWLEFQYGELLKLQNEFGEPEVEILFVANDASPQVLEFLTVNCIPFVVAPGKLNPQEWYINSVYRAYNFGVSQAKGQYVLLTNSDMAYMPGFLFNLLKHKNSNSYLVGKLIESGRLKPAEAAIKRNFGKKIANFKRGHFYKLARRISTDTKTNGGLYMPLLINRENFLKFDGYPEGNILKSSLQNYILTGDYKLAIQGEDLVSGDFAFVKRLEASGWSFETVNNAIAYHFQEGEKSEHAKIYSGSPKSGISHGTFLDFFPLESLDFPFEKNSKNFRLLLLSSINLREKVDNVILIGDDFGTDKFVKGVNQIRAVLTSNIENVYSFAVKNDVHVHLIDNPVGGKNPLQASNIISQILKTELRNSFLPKEPSSIRSIVARHFPKFARKIIRGLLNQIGL